LTLRALHLFAAAVDVLRLIIGLRLVILRAEPSTSGIPIKPKQQASVIGEAKKRQSRSLSLVEVSAATRGEAYETS
jgi:hypothetical protein